MNEIHRITVDPGQCGGRPCLRARSFGSRTSWTSRPPAPAERKILADYPLLEDGDITASLEYAARQSDHPPPRVTSCASSWTRNCRRPSLQSLSRAAMQKLST